MKTRTQIKEPAHIRVILADDKPDVISALRLLLEYETIFPVILDVNNSTDLFEYLKSECPTIIMLDWELPGINHENIMNKIKEKCQHACVIAMSSKPEARISALQAGVNSFVSKGESPSSVISTIKKIISNIYSI